MSAACQQQTCAEYGDRHDDEHFIVDGEDRGNRHSAEGNMGETVADKRVTFQHKGHAEKRGTERGQDACDESVAYKRVTEIFSNQMKDLHYL